MNTILQSQVIDNEQFWHEQIKLKEASGLSRAAYCRQHDLICSRFAYWENKLMPQEQATPQLLAVKLHSDAQVISQSDKILCSLDFKNGYELKIHDQAVLPLLLSLWH